MVIVTSVLAQGVGTLYVASLAAMVFASITPHWREVDSQRVEHNSEIGEVDVLIGFWRSCSQFRPDATTAYITRCNNVPTETCTYPYFNGTDFRVSVCPTYDAARTLSVLDMAIMLVAIACVRRYKQIIWPVILLLGLMHFSFCITPVVLFGQNDLIEIDGFPTVLRYSYWTWLGAFLVSTVAFVVHVLVSFLSVGLLDDENGTDRELEAAQARNVEALRTDDDLAKV